MTTLPPSVKQRIYLIACVCWIGCAGWLVGCVASAAPARVGCAAVLSLILLAIAIASIRHDMEMDALRARARPAVDPSEDLFASK